MCFQAVVRSSGAGRRSVPGRAARPAGLTAENSPGSAQRGGPERSGAERTDSGRDGPLQPDQTTTGACWVGEAEAEGVRRRRRRRRRSRMGPVSFDLIPLPASFTQGGGEQWSWLTV